MNTIDRIPQKSLELVIFAAGDDARIHALPASGRLVIGRAEDADIRIDDPSVSRRHAALHIDSAMRIEDLGSSNGTYARRREERNSAVDTRKVLRKPGETFSVDVGDSIVLGSVVLNIRNRRTALHTSEPAAATSASDKVVVATEAMQSLYEKARRMARSDMSILILGETGVGKEVLAHAIHRASARSKGPFLAIHCASLSESLLESELFGHKKGAFTGASEDKPGLFEAADGGTLFLDEIGELSPTVQVKMLRALDERTIFRVGERSPRRIDVRFIAATNRNLEAEVERGAFRSDLFYRLAGDALTIPPLRDRIAEIVPLARLFLEQECRKIECPEVPALSAEVIMLLEGHHWPGNVRELRNAMQRASVLCMGPRVLAEHLPTRISTRTPQAVRASTPEAKPSAPVQPPPALDKEAEEWRRIIEVLEQCAGNQTRAADILGISRRTLVSRLEKYGIPRPRKKG